MKQPADHPRTCAVCHGTGWQPGPDIPYRANGDPGRYSTVEPCDHHWADDDPTQLEPAGWERPRWTGNE